MTDVALDVRTGTSTSAARPKLDRPLDPRTAIILLLVLAGGLLYVGYSLYADVAATGARPTTFLPYLLLFVALLIALGFEFVNGFHDTANAVATVIYTHSLPAQIAVVWSGSFNFLGVLLSSRAVAFGIISLLPVELILQVGSSAGFAMVFALLIAAIIWNLGTWYLGLPASSSHTLIGSIIGVGIANALMRGQDGTSGVDWGQATNVGKALLFSPLVGFFASALLLLAMKVLIRQPELYRSPETVEPPAWWIRGLLVFTCTAVSFAHGSNDGQKGMGLIMLILIGTVPTAYALNRALPDGQMAQFSAASAAASKIVEAKAAGYNILGNPRPAVMEYVAHHKISEGTYPSLAILIQDIDRQVKQYGSIATIPAEAVGNTRNDMYLVDEALRNLMKDKDSERKRIKRVPVVKDGKLIGIVSRSNLIQALASTAGRVDQHEETDRQIRLDLVSRLKEQSWTDFGSRNITVSGGVVHLWGLVGSEAERKALLALAENVPGVARVSDEMISAY
jgi:PiT family inorganic phosphate transporter